MEFTEARTHQIQIDSVSLLEYVYYAKQQDFHHSIHVLHGTAFVFISLLNL